MVEVLTVVVTAWRLHGVVVNVFVLNDPYAFVEHHRFAIINGE